MIGKTIGTKLMFGFAVVVILSVFGSIVLIYGMSMISGDVNSLSNTIQQIEGLRNINYAVSGAVLVNTRWQVSHLSAEEYQAQFDQIWAVRGIAMGAIDAMKTRIHNQTEQKLFDAMVGGIGEFDAFEMKSIQLAQDLKSNADAAIKITQSYEENNFIAMQEKVFAVLNDYKNYLDDRANQLIESSAYRIVLADTVGAITAVLVTIIGISIGVLFPRSINNIVRQIAEILRKDADNVSAHSRELAIGSQNLAAGANQQAASVEKIAASIENVAAMVSHNADNASEANKLVEAARSAVDTTQKSMLRSLQANEEISRASNETYKIIKTIDEIAFQTNLLSLNAAVEAARAGDAGAGFAVVADEVRGLSMRSAEASKRTAELIEQTIAKVREGADIFKETGKSIDEVVSHVHKVSQLVTEVAEASGEQAKGLEQVNCGVAEIEKEIQQNAAHSEQSAAATQELHTQAAEIMTSVYMLEEYVFGPESIPQAV